MSNDFEKLKDIGVQKIHEQTNIPKKHVNAMIDKNFQNMHKVQLLGFISILEREYSLKLDELKSKASECFMDETEDFVSTEKLFTTSKRRNKYTKYYILLVALILIIVVISNSVEDKKFMDTPNIDIPNIEDTKITQEIATKIELPEVIEELKEEVAIKKVFKVMPNIKLWMGYIDLNTGKKRQKIFSDEFELDSNGHWLLSLGHGDVNFEINGELNKYKTKENLRFEYKNGELKKISYSEFLALNKGKKW